MSYCRMSDKSDIYLIATTEGWSCMGCKLVDKVPALGGTVMVNGSEYMWQRDDLLLHLAKHLVLGHKIPRGVWKRLRTEMYSQEQPTEPPQP